MIMYQNEVVRLLLEICILLLKVRRSEIKTEELNTICFEQYGIKNAAKRLEKKDFAVGIGWDKVKKQSDRVRLLYPIEVYQSIIEEIDKNRLAYIPDEIVEEDCRDWVIRGKKIWGTGAKAIVLVDDIGYNEENYHPRYPIGEKQFFNYKRNRMEAEKLAKEILKEYF